MSTAQDRLVSDQRRSSSQWDWPLQHNDGIVGVLETETGIKVGLEVPSFTAREIEVRVADGKLNIHCQHNEKADRFGSITRDLSRTYMIPDNIDPKSIKYALMPNGLLQITGERFLSGR